jgi:hypothetical protein
MDPVGKSADEIEREVEQTRASVSGTVDALRGRLQPGQIVDEVVDRVATYAKGSGGAAFARNLGASVRDHPLPVLLIGAGIGWLLLSKPGTPDSPRAAAVDPMRGHGHAPGGGVLPPPATEAGGDRPGGMGAGLAHAREAVGDVASRASDQVTELASRAASAASSAAETLSDVGGRTYRAVASVGAHAAGTAGAMRDGAGAAGQRTTALAQRAASGLDDLAQSQPLLVGVLGVAVGAALAAVLPRTRTEDRLLGEARDQVVARVNDRATEAFGEVGGIVGEEAERAAEKIKDSMARTTEQRDPDDAADAPGATAHPASSRNDPGRPGDSPEGGRPNP